MRAKVFVFGLLALTLVAAGVPDVWSQQPGPTTVRIPVKFRYSVKFVCGQPQEPKPCRAVRDLEGNIIEWICPESTVPAAANGAQLVRGLYATAINVHNPVLPKTSDLGTVAFGKKVTVALPWQKSGPVSRFERAILKSNHAFEIDCEEITAMVLNAIPGGGGTDTLPPFPIFLKGFLVIMSPVELDVTAVYSSRPLDSGTSAIDVEVIEPRKQDGVIEADIPPEIPSD